MATTKTIQPIGTTITIPAMTDRPDASVFSTDVDRITDAVNAENQAISTLNSKITDSIYVGNSGEDNVFEVDISGWGNGLWLCFNVGVSGEIGAIVAKRGNTNNSVFQLKPIDTDSYWNWSITGTTLRVVTGAYYRDVRRRLIWSL